MDYTGSHVLGHGPQSRSRSWVDYGHLLSHRPQPRSRLWVDYILYYHYWKAWLLLTHVNYAVCVRTHMHTRTCTRARLHCTALYYAQQCTISCAALHSITAHWHMYTHQVVKIKIAILLTMPIICICICICMYVCTYIRTCMHAYIAEAGKSYTHSSQTMITSA